MSVKRVKSGSLKPFWNEELDRLKSDSIFWHNMWQSAGRPSSGVLHQIKTSCKYKFKSAVRDAYVEFENEHNDEIYRHFLNKNKNEFWKAWHYKFKKKINSQISFPECRTDKDVAEKFADLFKHTFHESRNITEAVENFKQDKNNANGSQAPLNISVELIEKGLKRLHSGKACGPDDLSAEHLLYAHPNLIVHLELLFSAIIGHGYVPIGCGAGVVCATCSRQNW